jgi:hypothetical protein
MGGAIYASRALSNLYWPSVARELIGDIQNGVIFIIAVIHQFTLQEKIINLMV